MGKKNEAKGEKVKIGTLPKEETKSNEPAFNWAWWLVFKSLQGSSRADGLGADTSVEQNILIFFVHSSASTPKSHYDSYISLPRTRIIIPGLAKIGQKAAGYSVSSNNLRSN